MQSRLKIAILERREPQYVLASRSGIDETRLSRIVRGRVQPTVEERLSIATALGVPERELFAGSTDAPELTP